MNDTPDTPPIDTDAQAATDADVSPDTIHARYVRLTPAQRESVRLLRTGLATPGGAAAQRAVLDRIKFDVPTADIPVPKIDISVPKFKIPAPKLDLSLPDPAYQVATPAMTEKLFPPITEPNIPIVTPDMSQKLAAVTAPITSVFDSRSFTPVITPTWDKIAAGTAPDVSSLFSSISSITDAAWLVGNAGIAASGLAEEVAVSMQGFAAIVAMSGGKVASTVQDLVTSVSLASYQAVNATANVLTGLRLPTMIDLLGSVMQPLSEMISSHLAGLVTLDQFGHRVAGWTLRMARAARNAALHGEVDAVVWFAEHCLNIKGIKRFSNMTNKDVLDAVIGALLDDRWEHDTPAAVFDHIVDLKKEHHRGLKPLAEIQSGGRKIGYLDAVLPGADDTTALDVLAAETTATDDLGVWVPGGSEDVTRRGALAAFSPDELKVCAVKGEPGFRSWADAATEAGFDPAFGQRVRRKTKRVQKRFPASAAS